MKTPMEVVMEIWADGGVVKLDNGEGAMIPDVIEKIIEARDSEHAAALAKAEESVQKVIDAYCRYYLADDDSREERVALSQLEIELASLAIEVRGDNFLIDFAAALEGK